MNNALETRYFLSAMTGAGYYALHRQFLRPPERYFCILKGGPGCGKSTLMKRLARAAQEKGEPIQRIHCASDPDSLDGVIFLDKRAAIVDATAPHVMEPDAPGAEEQVVSLYHTLDADALHAHADEVKRLFAQNTALRSRAARVRSCAQWMSLPRRTLPFTACRRSPSCFSLFYTSRSRCHLINTISRDSS